MDPGYTDAMRKAGILPAEHFGVDLPAPNGPKISSPATGMVFASHAGFQDPFMKFLLIVDDSTGDQHILGHIDSAMAPGTLVEFGDSVGNIVKAGAGPHVNFHWGINTKSFAIKAENG